MHQILPALRHHRRLAVVATAVLSTLYLASSSFAATGTSVKAALVQEPQSLDPIYDTNLPALNIFYNVFDQLAGIDTKGDVVPRLATSWTSSQDLKSWSFILRPNVKCQDGTPLTAADIVFTYETAKHDPKSRLGGYLTAIDSITVKGEDEVDFSLNKPFAPFPRQTSLVPIVCKAAYERLGAANFAKAPIGSGPYSVVKWVPGDTITLKRFDDYWGPKGTYPSIVFQPVPDETTRANALQSGDLDIALLGPSSVPAVRASDTVRVISEPSNRILYLGFNAKEPWLDKLEIRKAMDLAINRKAVADKLLVGSVQPTSQLVAPVSFGFDPQIPATTTDLGKAKAMIAASGYKGEPITLSYPTTGLPQIDQIAQAVGYFLQQAGLNIKFNAEEADTYIGDWFTGKLKGVYLFAFAPTVMDADLPFSMLLRSGGQGYFSDSQIDALLDKQIGEADPAARAATLGQISRLVNEKTYYAPLFIDVYTYGVAKDVTWTPRPDGLIVFN
jgi:peptide/nickel transport system substrate-binding protein